MGSHPLNLALRFILEIIALISAGMWGWRQTDDVWRFLLMLGIPLAMAVLWATFAVKDDPSRSGKAPVPIPGILRLILELAFFGFAAWALADMDFVQYGWILGIIVFLHYIVSYDRIRWLLSQ